MYINKQCLLIFVLIIGSYYPWTIEAYRVFHVNGVRTILALQNEKINIECKTDIPITYCGFVHQSGKRYSFSGPTLDAGHCSISIKATGEEIGEWKCHLGRKTAGVEETQLINVRIVEEIAALQQNITAVHGKPVTLLCATTKELKPLSYCRFEPPNGIPFSIDSDITAGNPILNRYYFPKNKSLDRGDCAVTINRVQYEDVGLWTCGGGIDDDKEHTDVITLDVEGIYMMSKASVTGIAIGAIGLIAFFGALGFIAWKKRSLLGSRQRDTPVQAEEHELAHLKQIGHETPSLVIPKIFVQSPSDAGSSSATTCS